MNRTAKRKTGESVADFLDRTEGKNRVKYSATYCPRYARYGSEEPEISLEDMNATLRED